MSQKEANVQQKKLWNYKKRLPRNKIIRNVLKAPQIVVKISASSFNVKQIFWQFSSENRNKNQK